MGTIFLRGEGGAVQTADERALASPHLRKRVDRGDLVRVREDGSPWTGEPPALEDEPEHAAPEPEAEPGTELPDAPPLPAKSAPRATWKDFAVSQGMDAADAEQLTRAQLIEAMTPPEQAGE